MSDSIKHECGIALVRLLKPLEYYQEKYGTMLYGLNRMYLLMEKQHNRGQDGAGLASLKFDMPPGKQYIDIAKSNAPMPIKETLNIAFEDAKWASEHHPEYLSDKKLAKDHLRFVGELYLGHLRYGTSGKNSLENLHPFFRENNWRTRTLAVAGNFNMTNMDEILADLVAKGQFPIKTNDTAIILEKIGHALDDENERLYQKLKAEGKTKMQISQTVAKNLNVERVLREASDFWDGGYVMAGMMGHGDSFVMRDPKGIRPAFYYMDDEVVVVASERPVIMTSFNVRVENVHELEPGKAMIIRRNGEVKFEQIKETDSDPKKCSFERIYFSRGTDAEIYKERKTLGRLLAEPILKSVNHDMRNTVFSYIPNTASVAFQGLAEGLSDYCRQKQIKEILENKDNLTTERLDAILSERPRREFIAVKDVKMRTFITQEDQRDDMVAHVYDVTYGQVKEYTDNLVVIDDSIVRGTTLKQSILRILDRLGPKKIIVASSAPQVRYPDCYGIDMTRMGEFIAFKAVVELLNETKQRNILNSVYKKCKAQQKLPKEEMVNYVKEIYDLFTVDQVTKKITQLLTPADINAEVEIVYQTIENLHKACPANTGDWYFTGNYPTPGGNKVVNTAFINYMEGVNERSY